MGRYSIRYGCGIKIQSALLFMLGFLVYSFLCFQIQIQNPLYITGGALYVFSAILHFIYFTSPYLGDKSPSSEILFLLSGKKRMNYKEILNSFHDEQLIKKRIEDLHRGGYIVKKGDGYAATKKGFLLFGIIAAYKNFIKWNTGG